jgi:hypothetical protein
MKARVAFSLARAGGLAKASASTLQLLNLTRERATTLEPKMKALPFPRTMGSGKPDTSGIVTGGQEIVHAEEGTAYETLWRKYANRNEGQFQSIPNAPSTRDIPWPAGSAEFIAEGRSPTATGLLKKQGMTVYDRIQRGWLGEEIPFPKGTGRAYKP